MSCKREEFTDPEKAPAQRPLIDFGEISERYTGATTYSISAVKEESAYLVQLTVVCPIPKPAINRLRCRKRE